MRHSLPAAQAAATRRPGTTNGRPTGTTGPLFQHLVNRAHEVLAESDLCWSPAKVSRIVRRYVREGRAEADFRTWFISYADPTGETAVRNVMRGGGR